MRDGCLDFSITNIHDCGKLIQWTYQKWPSAGRLHDGFGLFEEIGFGSPALSSWASVGHAIFELVEKTKGIAGILAMVADDGGLRFTVRTKRTLHLVGY
jgi:hypothetical protein